MRIIITRDYDDLSRRAADYIGAQLILKPTSVLGLATGSTPIGTYQNLVAANKVQKINFAAVKTINLDEYQGLAPDHDQSYYYFMKKNLFDSVNIDPKNIHLPDGVAKDAQVECARYDQIINQLGPIDLQLLGLGANGHIGFNEPGTAFTTGTHLVGLTESTIEANARFFAQKSDVPRHAFTMGIGQIMRASKILLVVSGAGKAEILREAISGPVTPQVPATILQFHPDLTVIADQEAAKAFP